MRAVVRLLGFLAAALAAAVTVFVGSTLPPAAELIAVDAPTGHLPGAYHVHTVRSDGVGTVAEVAAAAAEAGLRFVILTDHGAGTREPDPPAYVDGVLLIDGVELATTAGHVVALGMARAPYPLGGRPADVIEDVHRLGGMAVVAHPDSPKPDLRWRGRAAAYDGLEWLNADSEWRDETPGRLLATSLRLFVRPSESVVSLFERPARTLERWDDRGRRRPTVGLAASDAHGGFASDEGAPPSWLSGVGPDYAVMFGALAQVAVVDRPLTGAADVDARLVLGALAGGRTYSVVTGMATPGVLEFSATQDDRVVEQGALVPPGRRTTFTARVAGAGQTRLRLLDNGDLVAEGTGGIIHEAVPDAGSVWRVEAYRRGTTFPWIVSNPIYTLDAADAAPAAVAPSTLDAELVRLEAAPGWTVEREMGSSGEVELEDHQIRFFFALGEDASASPYAALALPVESPQGFDRVAFTARASRPLRVSIQLRLSGDRRWGRSVYLDETPRTVVVPIQSLESLDGPSGQQPIQATVRGVLFVVDTVNAELGSTGTIWVSEVGLGVGPAGGQ